MNITTNNYNMKTKILVLWSSLWFLLQVDASLRTCTNVDNISFVRRNKQILDLPLGTLYDKGLVQCARECMLLKRCKSFSFDHFKGDCILFKSLIEHVSLTEKTGTDISNIDDWPSRLAGPCENNDCSAYEMCHVTDLTKKTCVSTNCSSPPDIPNAEKVFDVANAPRVLGTTLLYKCAPGFKAKNNRNSITCQLGPVWTTIACRHPRSCSEVKTCNTDYTDGEYWIYPTSFGGDERAKIYCYGMETSSSIEFVSLPTVNKGFYPNVSNEDCKGEIFTGEGGETHYSKIRVDIKTMEVVRNDTTFATTLFGDSLKYGEANDNYTSHNGGQKANCGPLGTFTINTKGTGLVVSRTLRFPRHGTKPWGKKTTSDDGSIIELLCGGFSGGCGPAGPMKLELNAADVVNDLNVTMPCP